MREKLGSSLDDGADSPPSRSRGPGAARSKSLLNRFRAAGKRVQTLNIVQKGMLRLFSDIKTTCACRPLVLL